MTRLCAFILAAFCLASCHWFGPDEKDRQTVLLYFAGNNNLSSDGEADLADIKASWLPSVKDEEHILLIYYHFMDRAPVLSRLYKNRQGVVVEDVITTYPTSTNSAEKATLEAVIADANMSWPAEHRGLVLWSHGSGFLPEGYYANPKESAGGRLMNPAAEDPYAWMVKSDDSKSFGLDNNKEMDLPALREALSGHHYDFLMFDCCLMGNVELAYELRNTCDYILFSPTEILVDGFPYDKMMEPLFNMSSKEALTSIAKDYMAHYRAQSGSFRSATITLVETAGLETLAAASKTVFQNHQSQILTLDRNKVQPYFRLNKHWYYDIDDFVGQIATDSEYRSFADALEKTVIFKDSTESFLSIDIKHYSGLSIYIPRSEYTVLNNYYKTLQWNQATGLVQ